MIRNVTLWLIAAALALLGVDRSLERQLDRERTAPVNGAVHTTDDGAGLPPPYHP